MKRKSVEKWDVWCFTSAFSVLVIWMPDTFQSLFLSTMMQVSGPGCVIIVKVFLGNKRLAWKVGCLEKGQKENHFHDCCYI